MTERDAQRTLDMSVIGILGWIKELLIDSCDIIDKLLGNKYAELLIRKTMGMGENQLWDKFSVEQLFAIVEAYISGASLLDIENRLTTKLDVFLKNARVFVIKVIPSISYMCGIIIQVLLAWLEKRGVTREDCPNDLRVFASCVKEGVFSYDMLMVKYRGRQMRVECHNKYQG